VSVGGVGVGGLRVAGAVPVPESGISSAASLVASLTMRRVVDWALPFPGLNTHDDLRRLSNAKLTSGRS